MKNEMNKKLINKNNEIIVKEETRDRGKVK